MQVNNNSELSVAERISNVCVLRNLCSLEHLPSAQRVDAELIISLFKELSSESKLGGTDKLLLTIDTGDATPFKQQQYMLSPYLLKVLNLELDFMLSLGVVESSHSPWCSLVLLVKKKSGEYRIPLRRT